MVQHPHRRLAVRQRRGLRRIVGGLNDLPGSRPGEQIDELFRQLGQRRPLQQGRYRRLDGQAPLDAVFQLDGHQRIKAQRVERPVAPQPRRVQSQDAGGLRLQVIDDQAGAGGGRRRQQGVARELCRCGRGGEFLRRLGRGRRNRLGALQGSAGAQPPGVLRAVARRSRGVEGLEGSRIGGGGGEDGLEVDAAVGPLIPARAGGGRQARQGRHDVRAGAPKGGGDRLGVGGQGAFLQRFAGRLLFKNRQDGGHARYTRRAPARSECSRTSGRVEVHVQPVALALEGVGRQGELAAGVVAVETAPIHACTGHGQRGQAVQQHAPIFLPAPQRRQPQGTGRAGDKAPRHADQMGLGSNLHENRRPRVDQRLHAVGKAHRLAHVFAPVGGVGRGDQGLAGQVGDERDARRMKGHLGRDLLERVQHGVHQGGVEGVRNGQGAEFNPLPGQGVENGLDGRGFSRNHLVGGAVHRRQRNLRREWGQRRLHLLSVGEDRRHRPIVRQCLHQAPARGD
ncbi:hypothetical protein RZS08_05740 [Arthrospira platensis SPKY1]|nr:hypothetical protein [Arthrospira platensis SPKY1]